MGDENVVFSGLAAHATVWIFVRWSASARVVRVFVGTNDSSHGTLTALTPATKVLSIAHRSITEYFSGLTGTRTLTRVKFVKCAAGARSSTVALSLFLLCLLVSSHGRLFANGVPLFIGLCAISITATVASSPSLL